MLKRLILLPLLLAPLAGCEFVEEDIAQLSDARGFTNCGYRYGEDTICQPGQFCEDPTFGDCDIGCLSDVNCASNQECVVTVPGEPGYCRNVTSSTTLD